MRTTARLTALLVVSLVLGGARVMAQAAAEQATEEVSAKTWLQNREQIEAYLKTVDVVKLEELGVGVTKPRRAILPPGGPVEAFAWKVIPPGRPAGFWESYKSEIAAYELDKLLGLDMVPPTVERRVKGEVGAAVMWCSPTKSFGQLKGVPTPPGKYVAAWNKQLSRAKMFDNLIGNKDPNLGNWLVDPAWNLILIDHTRAFTTDKDFVHKKMDHVDGELWDKMKGLTYDGLLPALGPWVGKGELKALIQRRDLMQTTYDKQSAADPGFITR
jgi:hypothetical protein